MQQAGWFDFWQAIMQGQLQWQQLDWLWALGLPVAVFLLLRIKRQQQKQAFADEALWPWVSVHLSPPTQSSRWQKLQKILKLINFLSPLRLLALAWIALVIAMAGPSSMQLDAKEESRQGVDVMFDFDLSHSMLAEDMGTTTQVSRFTFAKNLSESLISELKAQDRVALNVFAGQSHVVVPLTFDKAVFLQALDTISPGLLPLKGSWLQRALIESLHVFQQTSQAAKVLVVFTDGAPPFWNAPELPENTAKLSSAQSQHIAQTGIKVIYVGVGDYAGATLPDPEHKTGKLHVNGLLVQSRLEESQLKRLAQQTGGRYLKASGGAEFLQTLQAEITSAAQAATQQTSVQQWHYYSHLFIWLALIFLLLAFYGIGILKQVTQRLGKANKRLRQRHQSNPLSSSLLLGVTLVFASTTVVVPFSEATAESQYDAQQQAFTAFKEQDFATAEAIYSAIDSYEGLLGAGSAAYRQDDLEGAVVYFRAAAWQASTELQRAQALFNLGNSYYRANLLPQAIEAYEQAIKYQTPYDKAEHNLALAQQRHKQAQLAKQPQPESGEGKGKGNQGKDADGAFYGGQKPNPEAAQGKGGDGDADSGSRHGNQVNLPPAEKMTDFRINPSIAQLRLNSRAEVPNTVLQAQRQQQRAEAFAHELQQLKDDQAGFLQRLFEREAGFEATQSQAHPIPGVQPW